MKLLPFNTRNLHPKYQLLLAVLPLGLVVGSFLVYSPLALWLTEFYGITEGGQMIDDANTGALIANHLFVLFALLMLGVLIGWIVNAAILRVALRWSLEKTRRVFFFSEVPDEWKSR